VATIIQNVGHVLDEQRERLGGSYVVKVSEVEVAARVDLKGAGMLRDLPQLCAADTCIGLARRSADNDVKGVLHGTKAKLFDEIVWLDLSDVPWAGVQGLLLGPEVGVEIPGMGGRREVIKFHRGVDLAAGSLKSERDPAAT
jgi:hypothetical protein